MKNEMLLIYVLGGVRLSYINAISIKAIITNTIVKDNLNEVKNIGGSWLLNNF